MIKKTIILLVLYFFAVLPYSVGLISQGVWQDDISSGI